MAAVAMERFVRSEKRSMVEMQKDGLLVSILLSAM